MRGFLLGAIFYHLFKELQSMSTGIVLVTLMMLMKTAIFNSLIKYF